MRATLMRTAVPMLMVGLAVPVFGCGEPGPEKEAEAEATEPAETAPAEARVPSIEGTWRLVSREMPDGTVIRPPDVLGAFTYAGGLRNFNVFWTGPEDKRFSYSVVSEFSLSGTEYSETMLFSAMNDEIAGTGLEYELSRPSETVPVTVEEGVLSFDLPFDPVLVTVEEDRLIARAEDGSFIDHWERVRE